MDNPILNKILIDYGYDPDWPIDESNILRLMKMAYDKGQDDLINQRVAFNIKKQDRDINKPIIKAAIKHNYPTFDEQDIKSYYAEYFEWNCVAQVALKLLREVLVVK